MAVRHTVVTLSMLRRTVSDRVNIVYPEQPPLHLLDGNHVSGVLNHVRDKERRQTERRVKVGAHDTKRAEEALHRKEPEVDLARPVNQLFEGFMREGERTKRWYVKKPPGFRARLDMK